MTILANHQAAKAVDKGTAQSYGVCKAAIAIERVIIKVSSAVGRTLIDGFAAYATAYCGQPIDIRNYKMHLNYYTNVIQAINIEIPYGIQEMTHSSVPYDSGVCNEYFDTSDSERAKKELSTYMSYPRWSEPASS